MQLMELMNRMATVWMPHDCWKLISVQVETTRSVFRHLE